MATNTCSFSEGLGWRVLPRRPILALRWTSEEMSFMYICVMKLWEQFFLLRFLRFRFHLIILLLEVFVVVSRLLFAGSLEVQGFVNRAPGRGPWDCRISDKHCGCAMGSSLQFSFQSNSIIDISDVLFWKCWPLTWSKEHCCCCSFFSSNGFMSDLRAFSCL